MSDDAAPAKRGRKANAEKAEKVEKEKPEPKKRGRKVKTKKNKESFFYCMFVCCSGSGKS